MNRRIELQPAFVLHTRAFRNTSLLVDFFSLDHGRVPAVARGARQPRSRRRVLLQAFQPLLVSLGGRGELKTLSSAESSAAALSLEGARLFSGLYLNELLVRLLPAQEAYPQLFSRYRETLLTLHAGSWIEPALRRFELTLLSELGYGLDLYRDCRSGAPIGAQAWYLFHPLEGLEQVPAAGEETGRRLFRGAEIIALREDDLASTDSAAAAKRLLRQALQPHLGPRPLLSRELFSGRKPAAE